MAKHIIKDRETVGLVMPTELFKQVALEARRRRSSLSSTVRQILQEALGVPVEETGRRDRLAAIMAEYDEDGNPGDGVEE